MCTFACQYNYESPWLCCVPPRVAAWSGRRGVTIYEKTEMRGTIDCFLPCADISAVANTLRQLKGSRMIRHIHLMVTQDMAMSTPVPENCSFIAVDGLLSSSAMHAIAESCMADYALVFLKTVPVSLGQYSIQRMMRVAAETDASMVYSDRISVENGEPKPHPVIDWQEGSLRDDFDFGSVVMIKGTLLNRFARDVEESAYRFAGWYELWLYLSRCGRLFHINEMLYTE